MSYRYFFSNKVIQSNIEWPFFSHSNSKSLPDINIFLDKNIFPINSIKESRNYYEINMDKSVIYLKDKAYIEIKDNGKNIFINIFQDEIDNSLCYKIANQIIPYSIYMQQGFVLHASCITMLDGCILFVGRSGAGKSTLASSFLNEKILSEDFISLEKHNDCYLAYPTTPFIKISSNIISKFGLNNSEKIPLDDDFRERNLLKIHNFERKPKKVLHCFFLKWERTFPWNQCHLVKKFHALSSQHIMHFLLVRALKATIIYLKISVNSFVAWKYQRYLKKKT